MDIRTALKKQSRWSLAMLRQTLENYPEDIWLDATVTNRYWRIAYHTLFFTHFYLQHRQRDFKRWHKGRENAEKLRHRIDPPYTQAEILEYADFIEAMIDHQIDTMDLDADESGFPWYPMPKLEHQFVNLRHIQHRAGQLADRLRNQAGLATDGRG